jgi:hypothetical protein
MADEVPSLPALHRCLSDAKQVRQRMPSPAWCEWVIGMQPGPGTQIPSWLLFIRAAICWPHIKLLPRVTVNRLSTSLHPDSVSG